MKPHPLYPDLPAYTNVQPGELLIYIMLGGFAACGAWLFIKTMAKTEFLMNKIPVPAIWRLPIGGVLVGLISISYPHVWAGGHDTGNEIMHTMPPLFEFILVLCLLKILATAITVGSGGSGGLFTPSIFVGLCVGMMTGMVAQELFPNVVSDPRSYGTVGMAAGLAATTQAPIMAIFLVVEMTGEFELVPPLLLATLTGSVCARTLGLESIYLAPLRRRGIHIPEGIEETALTTTRVNDIMRTEAVWISETASFDMIVGMVKKTRKDFIYVVDDKLRMSGCIRLHDIKGYLGDEELGTAVIAADLVVKAPVARPSETLADIMERFDDAEVHELAVVDDNKQIIGVVDRRDLISALSVEVLKSGALRAKFVMPEGTTHYVEMPPGHTLARVAVPKPMVGKTFGATNFRRKTSLSVLTIIRKRDGSEKRILPETDIELREGDVFIVMGSEEAVKLAGGEI
jgi:CIC family chloride channel protein